MTQEIIKNYQNKESAYKIAKKFNLSSSKIYKILRENNIKIRDKNDRLSKYKTQEDFFDKIDTPEKAYFLGFLYADGCRTNNIIILKIQEQDKETLEKLNSMINIDRPLKFITNIRCTDKKGMIHKCKNAYELKISSKRIADNLNKFGIEERKTDKIRFPFWIERHLLNHFVRGFFDGDGSISFHNRLDCNGIAFDISFSMKNEIFCNELQEFLKNFLNIESKKWKSSGAWKIGIIKNKDRLKFLDWIYINSTIHLSRKYEKYLKFKKMYLDKQSKRTSKYKGVSFLKNGKWIARKMFNYKNYIIGYFSDELEALEAYNNFQKPN